MLMEALCSIRIKRSSGEVRAAIGAAMFGPSPKAVLN